MDPSGRLLLPVLFVPGLSSHRSQSCCCEWTLRVGCCCHYSFCPWAGLSGAVFWGLIEVRCEAASDLGGSHLGSMSSIDDAVRLGLELSVRLCTRREWYFLTVASANVNTGLKPENLVTADPKLTEEPATPPFASDVTTDAPPPRRPWCSGCARSSRACPRPQPLGLGLPPCHP